MIVNCEGCEWELLHGIFDAKSELSTKIDGIEFGAHYYPTFFESSSSKDKGQAAHLDEKE